MVTKTVMVVQSSTTGKILLRLRNNAWGFASENRWDNDQPMLFNGLVEIRDILGLNEEFDGLVVDFVGTIAGIQIFHCVMESEPMPLDVNVDWFSLFNFPENFDPQNDRVFDHGLFIEKIISPTY